MVMARSSLHRRDPRFGTNCPKVDRIILVLTTTRHYVLVSKAQKRMACTAYRYSSSISLRIDYLIEDG